MAAKDGRHDLDLRVPDFAGFGFPDRRPNFARNGAAPTVLFDEVGDFRPQRGGLLARIFALRQTTPTILRSAGSPGWEMTGMVDHLTINLLRPERVTVIPTNSGLVFDRRPVLGSRPRWSRLREQRRALKHARAPSRPGTNGGALAESLGPASRTIASAFQSARPVLSMRTLSRPILTVPWPFPPDDTAHVNLRAWALGLCAGLRAEQPWIYHCGLSVPTGPLHTSAEQPWIYHCGTAVDLPLRGPLTQLLSHS